MLDKEKWHYPVFSYSGDDLEEMFEEIADKSELVFESDDVEIYLDHENNNVDVFVFEDRYIEDKDFWLCETRRCVAQLTSVSLRAMLQRKARNREEKTS